MEDSQDDCVNEAASDHVIPANDVDPVMFDDDSESKPVTAVVLNDVSDSLFEQEIDDSSIRETTTYNPPQNQKTRSLREIYEQTPVSDEHLQYALFSSHPTIFEEAMKNAQWVHESE